MDSLHDRVKKIIEKLGLDEKRKKVREIEAESTRPNFWQDHQTAAKKMKEMSALQKEVEEAAFLQELVDSGLHEEAEEKLQEMEKLLYFSGIHDESSAILGIHSGQGGTEQWIGQKCCFACIHAILKKWDGAQKLLIKRREKKRDLKVLPLPLPADTHMDF